MLQRSTPKLTRKRLTAEERRASIIAAATKVFAERGLDGTKTQQIAAAADVSEALIFRHFSNKLEIYRACLRKLIHDQDEAVGSFEEVVKDANGIITALHGYFERCLKHTKAADAEGMRIVFASIAGDGSYARLIYKRALKLAIRSMNEALAAARAAGEIQGEEIDALNVFAFIEHVGSMLMMARFPQKPLVQYSGDDASLLRQTVWFCARGIGITENTLNSFYNKQNQKRPRKCP